ncbi:MAG: NHL repeat-containing protein [Thermoplasmata archaeon]
MVRGPVRIAAILALIVMLLCSGVPAVGSAPSLAATAVAHETTVPNVIPAMPPPPPGPFWTGMPASLVLGEPNFTADWNTPNATTFSSYPEYATLDSHGDMWVTDFGGDRVLEFLPPFTDDEAASLVIGQDNFTQVQSGVSPTNLTSPAAAGFDGKGDLWVTDWGNNRLLEYVPPFHSGMSASVVLGQSSFTGNQPGTSAVNVSEPTGFTFDALGDLWVADQDNNRVLEFVPPFTTGMRASVVLGQSNFLGYQPGLTSTNLSVPIDVAFNGNWLWVADQGNDRVLGFQIPVTTGEAAYAVLGQSSFTTDSATGEAALKAPEAVNVDAFGDLWVSDTYDDRVLEFTPPFSNGQDPAVALGQSTLTGTAPADTRTNLSRPWGVAFNASGDLWVTDSQNNRLLEYVPTQFTVTLTEAGLPAGTPWTAIVNGEARSGVGALHFSEPNGSFTLEVPAAPGFVPSPSLGTITVQAGPVSQSIQFSATPPNPYSTGLAASVVIGQPNFNTSYEYSPSQLTANDTANDWDATFDSAGDLWVADADFNRVLEFRPPFTDFEGASLVLGQSSFSGSHAGDGAANLSRPEGVAFDASGNLWVSDSANNRVLEFKPPFSSGMSAVLVLGQHGFGPNSAGNGPAQLNFPFGLEFFDGNLWVADSGNNRVLEYPSPVSGDESAITVLGQATLSGDGQGLSSTNLSEPEWIAFDAQGDAWVSDSNNNRVLEYPAPLTTGEAATVVLGQPDMTSSSAEYPNSFNDADGVAFDARGNLWVADEGDSRALEFMGPADTIVTNETPSIVLGQANLTSTYGNTSRTGLDEPTDVAIGPNDSVWVVDAENFRIVGYVPSEYLLNFTATGLPGGTQWSVTVNDSSSSGSGSSISVPGENGTYDWSATPIAGWVASPSSGAATLNGANVHIAITYAPFSYTVTFTEKGLPLGTGWSVNVDGGIDSSTGTSITTQEPNGSYSYTVSPVSGYASTNTTGDVEVSGANTAVFITFTEGPSTGLGPGGSSGLSSLDLVLILVVVLVLAAALMAVLLVRRKKTSPPPAPWTPPPPPPAAGGGPPPGAL